jgi:hypothetical protein
MSILPDVDLATPRIRPLKKYGERTDHGIRSAAIYGSASLGPVNLFRHHPENAAERVEETEASPPHPSSSPETLPSKTMTPISLSPLEEATLCHALNRKVTRVLKDLSLDGLNIPAVIGGARQSRTASPDQPDGPIV